LISSSERSRDAAMSLMRWRITSLNSLRCAIASLFDRRTRCASRNSKSEAIAYWILWAQYLPAAREFANSAPCPQLRHELDGHRRWNSRRHPSPFEFSRPVFVGKRLA
jgi:hypothetical protein